MEDNDSFRYYSSGQLNDEYPASLHATHEECEKWTLEGSVASLQLPKSLLGGSVTSLQFPKILHPGKKTLSHGKLPTSPLAQETAKLPVSPLAQDTPRVPQYPSSKPWQPPDGGYGWVIVVASFFIQAITGSVAYLQGMMYPEFLSAFEAGPVTTAWASSTQVAIWFTGAMIAGPMVQTIGTRKVCILGATIVTGSLLMASASVHIGMLYVFYGLTCGIGLSFIFFPSVIVVQQYFVRRRAIAVAFANSGTPFGGFAMPPLCDFLLQTYGWRGTMMIMAGITAQVYVICYFFKPLPKKPVYNDEKNPKSSTNKAGKSGLLEEEEEFQKASKLGAFIKRLFDFSLLKNPNLVFDIAAYGLFSFGFIVPSMFLPLKARENGIPHPGPTALISIIGISDVVGRFMTGLVGQVLGRHRLVHYMLSMLLGGTMTAFSSLLHDMPGLAVYSAMFGLSTGMTRAYSTIVLTDMLGLENLPKAYGFKLFLNGITVLGSAPFAAFVMDSTSNVDMSFLIIGVVQASGGLSILILLILRKYGCAPVRKSWV